MLAEKIVTKLLNHLSSGSVTNDLITSLGELFDNKTYPAIEQEPSNRRCRHCGGFYNPNYHNSNSKNLCKLQYRVTRAYKNSDTTGWECDECGETWIREWGYTLKGEDTDEIGYCYKGPHDHSDPEPDHG